MNTRWFNIMAMMVILAGAGLRLPNLATRSLWFDEALAANNSRGTLAETVAETRANNSSPIVYPLILYAVQKAGHATVLVRLVSFLSSVGLIILVTLAGKKLIGPIPALMAAAILAVSPSQIHFAQEVREYAFSSLFAGIVTFGYLDYLARPDGRRQKLLLFALLASCPLIQYGLVLLGAGILLALAWGAIADRRVPWPDVFVAGGCLGAASLFSLLFTLRYQLGADAWYLDGSLFSFGKTHLVAFLYENTTSLLMFLTVGWMTFGLVVLGLAFVLVEPGQPCAKAMRKLFICCMGVALIAAMAHQYPFGGVRQCLYLAPLVSVAIALGLYEFMVPLAAERIWLRFSLVVSVLILAGVFEIRTKNPYGETENPQLVLNRLKQLADPDDDIYIYYGARPAFEFYGRHLGFPVVPSQEAELRWSSFVSTENGRLLIFGGHHRDKPEEYASEILSAARPGSHRLWLVFSHVFHDEDQRIIHDLKSASPTWNVSEVLDATNAALYELTGETGP